MLKVFPQLAAEHAARGEVQRQQRGLCRVAQGQLQTAVGRQSGLDLGAQAGGGQIAVKTHPLPGGDGSRATAINDRGQVVGFSIDRNGHRHAVLWTLRSG